MVLATAFLPLSLSLSAALSTHALSIPFSRRQSTSDDDFNFQNNNNETDVADIYTATMQLNGQSFQVQVDTGSSDLWFDTTGLDLTGNGILDSGLTQEITYGDGTAASGKVLLANITFGDFTMPQALISAPGSNATTNADKGLFGVGPPLLSVIKNAFSSADSTTASNGNTFLENVFVSNTSIPPIATFQLARSGSTGNSAGGLFTVGEVVQNMSQVQNQPSLPIISPDRFIVAMDGVVVNGQKFTGNSSFSAQGQSSGQTLANLDTGTSLATIPSTYAEVIYGNVIGAEYDRQSGNIILPCDTKLNVSFIFGGAEIPIHPIDTVQALSDGKGGVVCIAGFPVSDPVPDQPDGQDFLLGDSFLRNAYAVFNYGSFVGRSNTPSIQLLSTTNADSAFAEFDSLSAARNASITGKSTVSGSSGSSGSSDFGSGSGTDSASSPTPTQGKKNSATRMGEKGGQMGAVLFGSMVAALAMVS